MLSGPRAPHGLTLVELMTVLAVGAILLAFAVPGGGRWLRDNEVRSQAGMLLAALQAARAEAIARNAEVRLQLTDGAGRPGWQLGCVRASARCPAVLRTQPVSASSRVRWGASAARPLPALAVALAPGSGFPASVTFDALGSAAAVESGNDIGRIDITHAGDANTRRLVILIAARGMLRLCDPQAAAGQPARCA